jgi:hypothetical protein
MTIETELRQTLQGRAEAEPSLPGDLDEVRKDGRRKQRGHVTVAVAGVVAAVAVGVGVASTFAGTGPGFPLLGGGNDDEQVGDVDAFCELLTGADQAPPPEPGGNNADELTELLAVAPSTIRDDVRVLRDYHRDVYVEGDGDTDSYDNLPRETRVAVDRIDAFAGTYCEGYESGVVEDADLVVPESHPIDPASD